MAAQSPAAGLWPTSPRTVEVAPVRPELFTDCRARTPRTLRSAADVRAALAPGEVAAEKTGVVVHCPVV
jgi:hypothetical protein